MGGYAAKPSRGFAHLAQKWVPWVDRVWGQGVSITDMHQGAGWVRGEPSIPAAWKADAQGLPDPPSQLSAEEEEEEERKRERLVPELTRSFYLAACPATWSL